MQLKGRGAATAAASPEKTKTKTRAQNIAPCVERAGLPVCCFCSFSAVLLFRHAEARPQKKTAGKKRSAGDRIDDNVTAAFGTIRTAFLSAGGQPAAVPHERTTGCTRYVARSSLSRLARVIS